jgi:hypothetical protein
MLSNAQLFRVYQYQTAEAGEKELVYWFGALSSDNTYGFFGEDVSRDGLTAHSVELEYGLSNKWTAGLYLDFEQPAGMQLKHIKTKLLMFHGRFWEKGERPIDLGLYVEFIIPRKEYKESEEIEIKLILEKDLGFHRFVLNPTIEKKISGPDVTEGTEFALNGGWYYNKSLTIQPGVEFYSKWGVINDMVAGRNSKSYVFPTVDFVFGKNGRLILHTGVGIGLTDPADNFVFKSVLSLGFF